jgi:hypothetical protein
LLRGCANCEIIFADAEKLKLSGQKKLGIGIQGVAAWMGPFHERMVPS